jgi:F-type H+-transporting ATPase subunit a
MILRKFWEGRSSMITAIFLLFFVVSFQSTIAQEEIEGSHHETEQHKAKDFNAGEMIFEHVLDAHDWHIADIGDHPVTVPLPIIVLDEYNNLHMFMSSRFEHGHASYDGFKLEIEGENKGKIVPVVEGTMETDTTRPLPYDFSITKTVFAIMFSALLLMLIFITIAKSYKKREGQAPAGLQSFLEPVILFVRDDIAKPSIGHRKYEKYMPYLLTLFFFILINNLLGIVPIFPGGANVTGNIAVTMVMALFTFAITSFSANKAYWVHIINMPGVPWWLKFPLPIMPLVEIMGVFTKPFVLMVRLFANMLAGHIVVLGFISMIFIFGAMNVFGGYGVSIVSVGFSVFLSLLEILVAFIQAYVFTLLSALYFGMAMEESH